MSTAQPARSGSVGGSKRTINARASSALIGGRPASPSELAQPTSAALRATEDSSERIATPAGTVRLIGGPTHTTLASDRLTLLKCADLHLTVETVGTEHAFLKFVSHVNGSKS